VANQAIALQARAPQTDFMGRAIQQNAQMMNMMSQQRAAERQAAQAAQEMELARAAEGRAVTAEERAAREAQQEYMATEVTRLRNRGAAVGDDAGYQMWLSQVEQVSPNDAALFRQYSPTFDADKMKNILMEADKFIDKNIATPLASLQYGEDGRAFGVTVGGMGSPRAQEVIVQPPAGAQAALPQPPQTTPTPPFDDKIETAARAILKGAGIGNSAIRALTPEEFDRAADRADELKSAIRDNRVQPVSMATGPQMNGQPDLAAVVQDMMSSGQISQANLQLMRDTAGPANDAQLAEILRSNNIRIVPDGEPTMRSAVFRPGEDAAPQMQQVQAINRPGTQFRGKDPMQSPSQAPAVAGAVAEAQRPSIPRVRAEAEAGRPSAPETYTTRRAADQAAADVKFLEGAPAAIETVSNNLKLLDRMIGDARVNEKTGEIVYPPKGRKPHPGFEQVVGMGVPGLRLLPGSPQSDFDSIFQQVTGAAFLEAFETLKGGGQITEKEGEKATQALSRLGRNISEKEFIIATNELRAIMRRGLERAEARRARLKGDAAPATGQRQTPTKPKAKQLRYNPATGDFE